jgi:hypothetical protein
VNDFVNWGLPILAVAAGIALLIWDDYRTGNATDWATPGYRVLVEVNPTSPPATTRPVAPLPPHDSWSPRRRLDADWKQLMATHPELRSLNYPDLNAGDPDD